MTALEVGVIATLGDWDVEVLALLRDDGKSSAYLAQTADENLVLIDEGRWVPVSGDDHVMPVAELTLGEFPVGFEFFGDIANRLSFQVGPAVPCGRIEKPVREMPVRVVCSIVLVESIRGDVHNSGRLIFSNEVRQESEECLTTPSAVVTDINDDSVRVLKSLHRFMQLFAKTGPTVHGSDPKVANLVLENVDAKRGAAEPGTRET